MDKPTYAQTNAIYKWLSWVLPNAEAAHAAKWIEENRTKRETSVEMNRLHDLREKHELTRSTCFSGKFWEGYM